MTPSFTVQLQDAFSKALGRQLKGYVVLGNRTGILLVFEKGLSIELRSDSLIKATETDIADE